MSRILFSRGARGELIERLQQRLVRVGVYRSDVDGVYGRDTEAAVLAYQSNNQLDAIGSVDEPTWRALVGDVPAVDERALGVTASFEGHGYTLAQGNFDGQGITWGIIGFTLLNGEIASLVSTIKQRCPGLLEECFKARSGEFLMMLATGRAKQRAWADAISVGASKARLAQPWRDAFAALGTDPRVQQIQRERAHDAYYVPAQQTARTFNLKSELGMALAFDVHVQNGGIKEAAQEEIEAAMHEHPPHTEQDVRVMIANAVADQARPEYRDDVRSRKLTLATGAGKVHGATYVLANWGLADIQV